jgi:hypothetical protein
VVFFKTIAFAFILTLPAGANAWEKGVWQQDIRETVVEKKGFSLTKKAKFSLVGEVLAVRDYSDQPQSQIAPTDIVLNWGERVDPRIVIEQKNRWYYASPKRSIDQNFFLNTSNFHMIGLSNKERSLLNKGDTVKIEGWLVDVRKKGGFFWKTSTTRDDRGSGACEILLVDKIFFQGGAP